MKLETESPSSLLTVKEAAQYLKVSDSTMWRWVRENKIPTVKLGRLRRVRLEDLVRMVEGGLVARDQWKGPFPVLTPKAGIFKLIGIGESGLKDVGERHDEHLAGASER